MNKLLDEAIEAARRLPESAQQDLAEMMSRQIIESQLASSEASLEAGDARPAETVFERLIAKYGG